MAKFRNEIQMVNPGLSNEPDILFLIFYHLTGVPGNFIFSSTLVGVFINRVEVVLII